MSLDSDRGEVRSLTFQGECCTVLTLDDRFFEDEFLFAKWAFQILLGI